MRFTFTLQRGAQPTITEKWFRNCILLSKFYLIYLDLIVHRPALKFGRPASQNISNTKCAQTNTAPLVAWSLGAHPLRPKRPLELSALGLARCSKRRRPMPAPVHRRSPGTLKGGESFSTGNRIQAVLVLVLWSPRMELSVFLSLSLSLARSLSFKSST